VAGKRAPKKKFIKKNVYPVQHQMWPIIVHLTLVIFLAVLAVILFGELLLKKSFGSNGLNGYEK
jgi:uncharacterized membrane protein